jgi:hypothetical protein
MIILMPIGPCWVQLSVLVLRKRQQRYSSEGPQATVVLAQLPAQPQTAAGNNTRLFHDSIQHEPSNQTSVSDACS